jgi:iron complex outermembrane recepter protein
VSYGAEYSNPATVFSRSGEFFAAADASFRSSFSSSASASRYLVVDGYSLLNARFGYRWADWTLSVWWRNLLDTNYYELLSAAPGNTGLFVGQPGDQRTIGVTLRVALRSR